MSVTLDGMGMEQLRELIQRAEATIKQQQEAEKAKKISDKYLVTVPVAEASGDGSMVCVAKDGTVWYSASGGGWVILSCDWDECARAVAYAKGLPCNFQYKDTEDMNGKHRVRTSYDSRVWTR